jgi:glycosyltransferase involved in cell wall biosynthesis
VISCLRRAGVDVVEQHVPVWEGPEHKWRAGPVTATRLLAAEARLLRRRRGDDFDAIVVGYPGHLDLWPARRAARGRPVVFNPLLSVSDTLVGDRGRFRPGWEDGGPVLFVGKLIPLHGLETILAAAQLAPDLEFRIVGSGQLARLLERRPANVEHVPWIEYEELPQELHRAKCALGIFGTSAKARRVIPNKVFQALACGTPVVTADTPAARELLRDGESALLVPPGEPEALAAALRRVTPAIGAGGLAAYRAHASEEVLGARWRSLIESLL